MCVWAFSDVSGDDNNRHLFYQRKTQLCVVRIPDTPLAFSINDIKHSAACECRAAITITKIIIIFYFLQALSLSL